MADLLLLVKTCPFIFKNLATGARKSRKREVFVLDLVGLLGSGYRITDTFLHP